MIKIACLQFAPKVGEVERNIREAEAILEKTSCEGLQWLVLPEMAFSGYNFPSREAITPYLEPTTSGPSTIWAIKTAKLLKCHVSVGYPEISHSENSRYNSVVTVSPDGLILGNNRKKFLYYTDETWASEGQEFFAGELGALGKVSMGICMDINPYKFLSPWTDYEFANAVIGAKSPLVVLSMAWISSANPAKIVANPDEVDMDTLSYWLNRFSPIIKSKSDTATYLVMANRCGEEGGVWYAGTSTVMKVNNHSIDIYGSLGVNERKCLVVDTNDVSDRQPTPCGNQTKLLPLKIYQVPMYTLRLAEPED